MSGGNLISSKTFAGSTGSRVLFPESRIACCCPQTLRVSRKWNCTSDLKHSTSRICCRRPIIDKGHVQYNFNVFKHGTFLRMTDYGWQPKRCVKMAVHSGSDSVTDPILVTKRGRNPLWSFFESASDNKSRGDGILREIIVLALPALIAQAVDPVAQLMETAFIGRIGVVELAAVGVSISTFNLVSRMFNMPLLNVTTSFVADDASKENRVKLSSDPASPTLPGDQKKEVGVVLDNQTRDTGKPMLASVSSALVLGTFLGIGEAGILAFLAGPMISLMGVSVMSPMRGPAVKYLVLRAFGAPALVISFAVQGIFRGFKDTRIALSASLAGSLINILLEPILMFTFHFGVSGAAVATVASQYVMAGLLLWNLNKRVVLLPPQLKDLHVNRFLKSGGFLLGRSLALLVVWTLSTSMAARQGPIPMAAHQICRQLWFAAALLSDSLALAAQAIISTAFAQHDYKQAEDTAFLVLQIGAGFGILMGLVLWFGMPTFSRLFTKDSMVLEIVASLTPFLALTQPINSLAFVFDGLHYGASDFSYAAYSMVGSCHRPVEILETMKLMRSLWNSFSTQEEG
ncbi:hypothetical protein BDL97_03G032700 [Sphagnum fallax]|nr:hypothetical protein BDL97_03G032700 [Sphagnum fallax]